MKNIWLIEKPFCFFAGRMIACTSINTSQMSIVKVLIMPFENLTHLSLIQVTGDDAKTFLQGQLTNDINALDTGWQYSAYCTPKGRTLAVFIVSIIDDQLFLLTESALVEAVIKRLRMYVMRSNVVFKILDHNILGAHSRESLTTLPFEIGPNIERFSGQRIGNDVTLLHFGDRCLILDASDALNGKSEQPHAIGDEWVKRDINDGLPRVTSQSNELFIPQMLNMDLNNGISFKKGCYTGQEIVARMHYLGKLKQRSFVCNITNKTNVSIGEKLSNADGKSLGNVVNAVDGNDCVFASLRFDPMPNVIYADNGAEIEIRNTQPYDLGLPT